MRLLRGSRRGLAGQWWPGDEKRGEGSLLTHAEDNHMKGTRRWSIFVAAVALIAVATFLVSGLAGRALADEDGGLGDKIAGTYLAVLVDGAQMLQISRDGNLSFILSSQFSGGGVLGESFSNTLGSWKKTGTREITAGTVDLTFKNGAEFMGVAATTNVIKFDRKFQTATMTCQGRIFPPGVDPFDRGAIPIANSEF
ncbi:MAG TPA: hypothetical protein VKJ45_06510, partial [Blastocatellia bacterium]|nr:hypothetical protein [Blastocatellia bacterium]